MSKIIGVIPPQNYELIRNKIAEIIAIELENQFAISYDPDFDCNVWLERTTPFDAEEMTPAVINVSFIDGNYQNEDPKDADGVYSYAVDVYARGYTNEENIGDTRAALIVQKVIGKIRAILMATVYKTVDTGLGIVKNRRVASVQVYDPKRHPQGDDSTTFDQAGRIVFNVTAIETVETVEPRELMGTDTWVRWCCTEKGYVWINDGQTNGTPGNPNVCPPIPPTPPLGPYLRTVAVDGVTITGDGTPLNPLKGSAVGNSILLQTDGVDNESQTILNLKQGNNITITDDGDGGVTIQASGTLGVNSVAATAPLSSSGGANPNISIPQATTLADGYLSSADWDTFNDKQDALTLTTTGTSGAATLVGSVLNIPQYSSTGGGAVDSVNGQTGDVVLDTDDISDTATNRYTNDTDIARLANTSGTNTGDQDLSGLVPYTGSTADVDLGANGLDAEFVRVTGTNGRGDIHLRHQATDATATGQSTSIFADANGDVKIKNDGLDYATFKTSLITDDRVYTFPDKSGTVAMTSDVEVYTEGTGIDITGNVITNTAPDQTVVLNQGAGIAVTGTYPNFTIANTLGGITRSEYTASNAASIDVPIPAGYSHHRFFMVELTAGTANSELWHQVGIGSPSVIQSGASSYFHYRILGGSNSGAVQFGGSSSDTKMVIMGAAMPTGSAGQSLSGNYTLYNPDGTTLKKQFNGNVSTYFNNGAFVGGIIQSTYTGTDAVTSIRFQCSVGNISGKIIIESYL